MSFVIGTEILLHCPLLRSYVLAVRVSLGPPTVLVHYIHYANTRHSGGIAAAERQGRSNFCAQSHTQHPCVSTVNCLQQFDIGQRGCQFHKSHRHTMNMPLLMQLFNDKVALQDGPDVSKVVRLMCTVARCLRWTPSSLCTWYSVHAHPPLV